MDIGVVRGLLYLERPDISKRPVTTVCTST
jgi:hypothetical protein